MAYGTIDKAYLTGDDLAPAETNRKKLSDALPGVGTTATKANFGTNTTARWFRLIPLNGTGTDMGAGVPPFAFANVGWKIDPDDLNSVAGAFRFIASEDWTLRGRLTCTAVTVPNGRFNWEVWRVAAGGASAIRLFTLESADAVLSSLGTNFSAIKAAVARVEFDAGETLMVEVYVRCVGVAITGNTVTLNIEDTEVNATDVDWPGNLQTVFPQSLAETVGGSEALGRRFVGARPLPETVTGADSFARRVIAARGLPETVTGLDNLGRVARFPRALPETVTGIDALGRRMLFPRAFAEMVTGSDALNRSVNYLRGLAEAVTGADSLLRVYRAARALSEIMTGSDALARRLIYARSLAEAVTAAEVLVRQLIYIRALGENAPSAETLARRIVVARQLAESVTGIDNLLRVAIFNRALAETVTGLEALARQFAGTRQLAESAPASDALNRSANYVRELVENLTEGGGDVTTVIVIEEDLIL